REIASFLAHLTLRNNSTAQPFQNSSSTTDANATLMDFLDSVRSFSYGRRAFLTRDGRIGIGPKMMQPDDEIVVFFGARLPFVIRPRRDFHVFVGECYLRDDDIMWGEATKRVKFRRGPPVVTFELR